MNKIKDLLFDQRKISKKDLFIFAIGYDKRSVYLYERIVEAISETNILILKAENNDDSIGKAQFSGLDNICQTSVKYNDGKKALTHICDFIRDKGGNHNTIHIDYSSMPRSWYCRLPFDLWQEFQQKNIYFWYSVGVYPGDYIAYPSAGVDFPSVRFQTTAFQAVEL